MYRNTVSQRGFSLFLRHGCRRHRNPFRVIQWSGRGREREIDGERETPRKKRPWQGAYLKWQSGWMKARQCPYSHKFFQPPRLLLPCTQHYLCMKSPVFCSILGVLLSANIYRFKYVYFYPMVLSIPIFSGNVLYGMDHSTVGNEFIVDIKIKAHNLIDNSPLWNANMTAL